MFPGLSSSRFHTASDKSLGDKPGNEVKTDMDPEMARDSIDVHRLSVFVNAGEVISFVNAGEVCTTVLFI